MTKVRLSGVHKTFKDTHVIKGVDLAIEHGEFMVFVGPSGCGKSTLLRLVSGLEELSSGDILFDDEVVSHLTPSNRKIAMVFQSYALYPHMNVFENIAFGMKLAGQDRDSMKKRVMEAAEMLQIAGLLDRLPRQLSGGQRQRVAIGRAIVRDPRVFLFDEPLSNLDAALRVATRLEIAHLHRRMSDTTMIYVTHDQVEAMTLADRICVLRDGIVEQVGTPDELYERPDSIFVAGFIGSPKMNFLTGERAAKHDAHTIGVRPEHLDLVAENGDWEGEIVHVENIGSDFFVFVETGEELPMLVRQNKAAPSSIGTKTGVKALDASKIHRFDNSEHALR